MFVRNLLQAGEQVSLLPGEYVVAVPVGIPLTIQYSDKGLLQKVYLHHAEDEWVDKSSEYFQILFKRNQVPNKITLQGSTSYVRGVLVTKNMYTAKTNQPDSILTELCADYLADPESFKFYAGDMRSNSATFKGALSTRQWLTVSGFQVLPGYVVPHDVTESQFEHLIKLNYPFIFPLIDSYIVFHGDDTVTYPHTQLKQIKVKSTSRFINSVGNIMAEVVDALNHKYDISYVDLVHHNIQPGSIIVVDAEDKIVHCLASSDQPSEKISNKIRCDCCGRQLIVPDHGVIKCTDPQCNSVLYPRVTQLCNDLNMPVMSYEDYKKFIIEVGSVFTVLDIFEHPDYKDVQVEITIDQGLRAIVPRTVLPGHAQITQLCDMFSNSVQTLTYYIQNPDKISIDFDLDEHVYSRFLSWIQNVENRSDVVEFFKMPNISIIKNLKKFEGAPIFRGKLIYVTGSFMHGSFEEVSNILRSYAADVTNTFSNTVSCVVIGDGQEGINGHAIIEARKSQIPVMSESEFFAAYEIDADLAENL